MLSSGKYNKTFLFSLQVTFAANRAVQWKRLIWGFRKGCGYAQLPFDLPQRDVPTTD